METKKFLFKNQLGQNIIGLIHVPDGDGPFPVIVYAHGYRSTKESSKAVDLAKTLPKDGIIVLHFDFSGRGESEGKFEDTKISQYVDDLKSAVNFVETLAYVDKEKICIIGNSLGGLTALQEVINDKRIKALVLMSPVSNFPWRKDADFAPEKIEEWKKQGWTITTSSKHGEMKIGYQFFEDGLQFNDYSVYEKITSPTLVIHGTADASVSLASVQKLMKHLPNAELIVLEGADHTYTKKEDYQKVLGETEKFFKKHLK